MADFCNQCCIDMGFDPGELAGISTPEDTAKGLFAHVICEGCGWTQVDHEGNCIHDDCLMKGHKQQGASPMPYVKMTLTIVAGYHVANTSKSVEEVCIVQEATLREQVENGDVSHLIRLAKEGDGTITWSCKPAKAPPSQPQVEGVITGRITSDTPNFSEVEKDPRVKAELNAISQGRAPKGGNI